MAEWLRRWIDVFYLAPRFEKFLVNFIKSYPKIRNFIENVEFLGQPYEINVFNDTNTDYYLVRK